MGPIRRSMKRKSEPEPATHPPAAEAEARGVKPVRFLVRSSERLPVACYRAPVSPGQGTPATEGAAARLPGRSVVVRFGIFLSLSL
jgi:hypothetical protein